MSKFKVGDRVRVIGLGRIYRVVETCVNGWPDVIMGEWRDNGGQIQRQMGLVETLELV